ncbi:MAG: 30S ribosomal protein S30e [Thaumarchaeota archaeon]|jgi:small subunit ribosomal protein S30e|nr:MAG: Ribosomal protein S30 (RP-S30e, RPS30) [Nitrosopumilales archaeon]MCZ6582328.1 30S ribosomal protein S30e [Nitrososphaerota archaeon]
MPTHGSLTKAGKVKGQTPKVEGRVRIGTNAIIRNKENFRKRFTLKRYPGQNKPGRRRRPRRN